MGAEPYGPPALEVDSRGAMVGDRMRWGIYSTWTVSPLQYSHLWCQYWWHMATTFEAHGTSMSCLHLGFEENFQIHLRKEWSPVVDLFKFVWPKVELKFIYSKLQIILVCWAKVSYVQVQWHFWFWPGLIELRPLP